MRMSLITAPLCEYYQTLFALGVDKARARCYNVRYVNGILNIYFRVRGGGTLRARIYDQGISRMSAGVGTLFARQNPCQLRGLATPDSAIFLVIFTPKSLDRPPHSHVIITYWLDGLADKKRGTSYV